MCERTRGGLRRGEQGRGGHAHVTARRWLHRGRGGSCWVQEGSQTGTTESRTADGDGDTAAVHHSLRCVEVQRTALQCMAHGAEALCCRTACVLHGCLACVAAWLVPCALWRGVGMGALVPAGSLTCDMRLRFACIHIVEVASLYSQSFNYIPPHTQLCVTKPQRSQNASTFEFFSYETWSKRSRRPKR